MSRRVVRYEETPNPDAIKCWVDRPVSDRPRSFLDQGAAAADPLAAALFKEAGATNVLFLGDWLTVTKARQARWPATKRAIERVLETVEPAETGRLHPAP